MLRWVCRCADVSYRRQQPGELSCPSCGMFSHSSAMEVKPENELPSFKYLSTMYCGDLQREKKKEDMRMHIG